VADQLPTIKLNANQRRHFEVLLARLEDSLTKIERLLDDAQVSQSLTTVDDDVPPDFRSGARAELPRIRSQVDALVAALALQPRTVSLRRLIGATLTTETVRIEDSFSTHLRGYGQLDPSVAEHVDPALDRLVGALQRLAASLRK
jgi:hypothetical protein